MVCKWRFSALPVLMYLKVHSAPVLEKAPFSPRHCKNLNRSMRRANKKTPPKRGFLLIYNKTDQSISKETPCASGSAFE